MTTKIIPTTELNDCGSRCPLLVHTENGQITKITGNLQHPDLAPCIKGLCAAETFLSKDRLLYPMRRTGKRGEGKFERISWDDAIRMMTDEWIRIRDTYGVSSRYVHYGWGVSACMSGLRAARRLLALDGGFQDYYNSYSTACCSYTTPYLYGTGQSGSSYDTLLDSNLIILWAHNPVETHYDNLMYYLRQCRKKNIPIIVIDPRKNATVRALHAEWISINAGTDAALMDAMAYVIYTEDLYDHDFVHNYCQGFTRESMPQGSDPSDCYFDYLTGEKDGLKKDPAWAQHITGVPADTIITLARRFAAAKPAALLQGYGGQRHLNGEQFTRGGIMLACLTGNVGIRGGWASGSGHCTMIKEPVLPPANNSVTQTFPVYEWTNALASGQLKMIFSLAGNMLNQHGDINQTRKLLEDESLCECFICSDIFMTPTARYADLLLPGVSMFEADNLTSPWGQGDYITCVNKIIEPLGECREEYEWLMEVARNIDARDLAEKKQAHLYDDFTQGHPTTLSWLKSIYADLQKDYPSLPPYEQLQRDGIARLPHLYPVIAFKDKVFPTPSGKVEIYSPALAAMQDPKIPSIPCYVPSFEEQSRPAAYPLSLIGWTPFTRTHSVHDTNRKLQDKHPQLLWMHPDDAAARGIKDEDMVMVYNDHGRMQIPVFITQDIRKGCVALSAGAWYDPAPDGTDLRGSINVLTSLQSTPLAHGNAQHTNFVEVSVIL